LRRAVITGVGIVSCLGNSKQDVTESLKLTKPGITARPEYVEAGMRSHVAGVPDVDLAAAIPRKQLRFMGQAAAFAYIAMEDAIRDSGLTEQQVSNPRTGIIAGSGGASSSSQVDSADIMRAKGLRRVGPYRVTQTMGSTVSACLATPFKIKGANYSISSACSTSAHCIGTALEQIQLGKQDIVFAGGGEEEHWTMSCLFDAMGALSTKYNDQPASASRAYVGYGASSDGQDMVAPSGEGAVRCMKTALSTVASPVDYLNTHGTSTPAGDVTELRAVAEAFGDNIPKISSTKSLSGHSLGAAGAHEAIYSLLMMEGGFIAGSANIDQLDSDASDFPIVRVTEENSTLQTVMSNSFGFGGTNASLVFSKLVD